MTKPKPDLNSVISGASSEGFWSLGSRDSLLACLMDGANDPAVREALVEAYPAEAFAEEVYLTLLAWYILSEAFEDD